MYGRVYEWVQIVRKHNIHDCRGSHEYQDLPSILILILQFSAESGWEEERDWKED